MARRADIVPLVNELEPAERDALRSMLLDMVVRPTPDFRGGAACVGETRIPVWRLESFRRNGMPESRLLEAYPILRATDLVNAWAYVERHREEIDAAIHENEEA